ncbi:MAG TPA: tetratricopeptide repeat protein [Vulgatibacter sp.]|nr:tetratricopeptide repeat protein [Vulgatibacter sp.]
MSASDRHRRTVLPGAWLLAALLAASPTLAHAQEEAAPPAEGAPAEGTEATGSDPAEPTEASPAEASPEQRTAKAELLLEKALAATAASRWREAAVWAHEAWVTYPTSEERREAAELTLADTLVSLGFTQAAAGHYFDVVERRSMPQLLPRALAGVERLSRRGLVLEEDLLRGVLAEADLANIPPDLADFLHYQRGIANLRLGNRRWTGYEFDRIDPDGVYGQKARLAQAVSLVRENQPDAALEMVDGILAKEPDPAVEQEALLLRARLLFEAGRLQEAVESFRRVDGTRNVPGGEVLLERAWTHYREGKLHDAMGLVYALGAPAHADLFLPESYVLRGLIYQRFCHFRAARSAAAEFRARYGEAIARVEAGEEPAEITVVAQATSIVPQVAAVLRVSDAMREEIRLLSSQGSWMEEGGLRKHLDNVYGAAGARLERLRRVSVRQGAEEIAERLLAAREQANLLDYEVGVSIHRRVNDAEGKVWRRPEPQVVPRTGDENYYRFNGEFWTDELPDMRFLIENRCVE